MSTEAELMKRISQKEIESGVYSYSINGYSIYSLARLDFRMCFLEKNGTIAMPLTTKPGKVDTMRSMLSSLFQLSKLLLVHKNISNLLISFPRLDKISGEYTDKFTDSIIDYSNINQNCIIFEHGRGGRHLTPRYHGDRVIWIDAIGVSSYIISRLGYACFKFKYRKTLDSFFLTVGEFVNPSWYNRTYLEKRILEYLIYGWFYERIMSRLSIRNLFVVTRPPIELTAAKKLGVRTFEMQHGITYNETPLYAGYRDERLLPNFFLSFGDNDPNTVYGIDVKQMVNIGWAFSKMVGDSSDRMDTKEKDVLVVSDPEITDAIITIISELAISFPESDFYLRPHPHEHLNEEQMNAIATLHNVHIQDNSINIAVVLQSFKYVIGDSSTVLYEALSVGKYVGKLFMGGLVPRYLKNEDSESFCEIRGNEDFQNFINGQWHPNTLKSIYSPFDAEKLNSLLN